MFCSNCGYEIKAGVSHCPICGFPVPKQHGSFGFIKKDVGRIRSRYPYESVVVCTDLDDEKYKVYGDIFTVVSDY